MPDHHWVRDVERVDNPVEVVDVVVVEISGFRVGRVAMPPEVDGERVQEWLQLWDQVIPTGSGRTNSVHQKRGWPITSPRGNGDLLAVVANVHRRSR